jgi:hydroxypyruvate isomerase
MQPQVDASLTFLYPQQTAVDALGSAVDAGFAAFETWWPFQDPDPSRAQFDDFVTQVRHSGLQMCSISGWNGLQKMKERGLGTSAAPAAIVERHIDALAALASELGCPVVTMLYGNADPDNVEARRAADALFTRLAQRLSRHATLSFEQVNAHDAPGYALPLVVDATAAADRVSDQSGAHVGVTLDTYHAAAAGEDVLEAITAAGRRLAHVQVADHPGRHQPGTGTLDFAAIGTRLHRIGYRGAIGLECRPTAQVGPSVLDELLTPWRSAG